MRAGCAVVATAAALATAQLAQAHVVEHVRLGAHADGGGLSPSLVLVIRSPLEYERDTTGAGWRGPRYWASLRPTLGGFARIGWSVDVVRGRGTLAHAWGGVEGGTEAIERVVSRRPVGAIDAVWVLTRADELEGDARYEAGLRIPICGRTALLRLETPLPQEDSAGGFLAEGDYLVRGSVKPTVWNRAKLLETIAGVSLRGNLPATEVVARRRGRRLAGRVADCNGDPVARARVWLERRLGRRWLRVVPGTASPEGAYSLRAARPGTYRVSAGAAASAATLVP